MKKDCAVFIMNDLGCWEQLTQMLTYEQAHRLAYNEKYFPNINKSVFRLVQPCELPDDSGEVLG